MSKKACKACYGKPEIKDCPTCNGTGWTRKKKETEMISPPALDRTSEAYMRVVAAGFKLSEPYFPPYVIHPIDHAIRIDFTCICGRKETLNTYYDPRLKIWDGALEIERAGSTSEHHLRADGFSEQDIKRIRFVYDLWDEVKKLRRQVNIAKAYVPGQYMDLFDEIH